MMRVFRIIFFVGLGLGAGPAAAQTFEDRIAAAAQTETSVAENGVVRISWSRDDVATAIDGMPLDPAAGLGSWAAFKPAPSGAVVMGDTVVFEDEVTPAMDAALAHGLEITALHNHFIYDDPPVYFMHIGGGGSPEDLVRAVEAVWNAIREVRARSPVPRRRSTGPVPTPGELDAAALSDVFNVEPASSSEAVVKFTFPRQGEIGEVSLGGPMGLLTWAAFSGSDALAAVDGDFIMTADEVQPVIRALRAHDIHVVALHNHMIGEEPAFYFLHYWATGRAIDLADAVRSAMNEQAR